MSTFTTRSGQIEANLARGKANCDLVEANLARAETLLGQVRPHPWPWQRPGNARLRNQVRELIARNSPLQAENHELLAANSLLLAETSLERNTAS